MPEPLETPRLVVKDETRRYAEQLRATPGKASADGHTGWECTAGASLIAETTTPGPGRLGTLHATIYTCPDHQAAAEERITASGYTPLVYDAPPGHRWNPWPCGHMTGYKSGALAKLSAAPAPATKICGGPETDDKGNPLIQHISRYLDWAQSPFEGCISLTPDGADALCNELLPEGKDFAAERPDPTTADDPIPLRWGLGDVTHGDDDTVIVCLSGPAPDRAPYWLELDPERATAPRYTALDAYRTAQALADAGHTITDAITHTDMDAAADHTGTPRPDTSHDRHTIRTAHEAITTA